MSLFDLWFYGAVGFIVLTASMVLAFAIAITGPPTDEELDGLSAALGRASRDAAVLAQQIGDEACVQLPPEVTTGLCPAQPAEAEQPTLVTDDVDPPEPYPTAPGDDAGTETVQNIAHEAPPEVLLGASDRADPRPPRAERRASEGPRRARTEPRRERRRTATARPIERVQMDRVPSLPSAESGEVIDMQPAVEADLAPPEEIAEATVYERDGPMQEEAEAASYDPYEDRYERDRYADEEEGYYDEDYEERREQRREWRRARREQYYGGW